MQPKTIRIDGVIGTAEGEISAQLVRDQLPTNGHDPIAVKIHSEGGSVFEGFAIHDLFANYAGPKSLSIESSAFSIASFVAMAFDDVEISSNGYMMLHNPYAVAEGDDEALAKQAALLQQLTSSMVKAYANRSKKTEDEIKSILKAETYLNAQQAVSMGFATRIAGQPVLGRKFANVSTMPHGVVAALFGAGSNGNKDSKKGKPMSESTPVAATLKEIKAAFPKASSDFVVKCLEKSLPMASVATAAVEELMAENEQLKARVAAMEEEAKAATESDPIEPDEDDIPAESAKAKGVKPVAKAASATSTTSSAKARWHSAIDASLPKCNGNKMQAVAMASRNNPGLREAFLAEANAR